MPNRTSRAIWTAQLATFATTTLITVGVGLVELRAHPRVPLVSAEIGWTSRSVLDILDGGVIVAWLVDGVGIVWLAYRGEGWHVRPLLGRLLWTSAVVASAALGCLVALEAALLASGLDLWLDLPLALALGAVACGLYQLLVSTVTNRCLRHVSARYSAALGDVRGPARNKRRR